MTEQRVFILHCRSGQPKNLDALNDKLAQGWRVASATPMGGGSDTTNVYSVMVLERERPEEG